MNNIEKLLKAKGLTKRELARILNIGYHSFQKTVKGASYKTKTGNIYIRECPHIRKQIADWLGYPYELIWGPNSEIFVRKLINEEIDCRGYQYAHEEQQRLRQALGV